MSTRNDVAKEAGVSPAVVSYVLNNSNYVSEEKKKAVLKAVKKLNYYPNLAAKSLKSGKSKQFLLITDDFRNEMFSEIAFFMEPMAFEKGYSITLMSAQRTYDDIISVIRQNQFAGVFIFSGLIPLTKKYVDKLNGIAKSGIPIVLFMFIQNSSKFDDNIFVLKTNIRDSVCAAVDYLIDEKKHTKVAYIGDGDPIASGESQPFGDGLRVNGYLDSLRNHGIPPREDYVMFIDQFSNEKHYFLNVERVVHVYLSMPPEDRPTAFFVNSDDLAAVLMKRFSDAGIRTPEDVEIVGFGGTSSSFIVSPQLTTVDIPTMKIAHKAMEILLNKAEGIETEDHFFNFSLIKRGSA